VQAEDLGSGVFGSVGFKVIAAPPAQGVSIDFDADANGTPLGNGAEIGTQFSPWGISFRFVDAFAGGGDGRPNLLVGVGFSFLDNDRRSTFEYLTGSHELTLSVDIATFELEFYYPPGAFVPEIRAYDALLREIPGIVVEKVSIGSDWWALTVHSPVLIRRIKIGPSNGRIRLDNIVY
jgi:hypothetical protein